MSSLVQFALVSFTSVLFIVDPIAVVPTYLVITEGAPPEERAVTARRACIAGKDVAITPLAMPMVAGPGSISTIIVLDGQARTIAQKAVVYAAIVVTALISWIVLRIGEA